MILTADYHTHTTYSHGKGSVLDNATFAKESGLKEIGITDHGFSHPAFGLRRKKLPSLINDCKTSEEETGVRVLVGIESNLISDVGLCDLTSKDYDKFDLFLAGMHKFVTYRPKTFFKFFVPTYFDDLLKIKPSKWLVKENTKTFINCIKNNPIDVITHLNYCCFADTLEVAKACADYGTYLEISAKKEHFTESDFEKMLTTNVKFVLSSDAHVKERVGEVKLATSTVEKYGIPTERIANIDGRLPSFRFGAFKKGEVNEY